MFKFLKSLLQPPVFVEQQLAVLAQCGIALAVPGMEAALVASVAAAQAQRRPYWWLMCVLGDVAEQAEMAGPTGYLSDNIWHFDTECIAQHGDYALIARRLADLSCGALVLSEVNDFVDIESGSAWLSFRAGGLDHRWQATVDDDWVDATILSRFVALLARSGSPRRYTYIGLTGQDCLIGCATPAQMDMLGRKTGLAVRWLD